MTFAIRFAMGCGLALGALAASGCSSGATEPQQIDGKTPADFRDEMEKKISRPLGDPPPKARKSGGRR